MNFKTYDHMAKLVPSAAMTSGNNTTLSVVPRPPPVYVKLLLWRPNGVEPVHVHWFALREPENPPDGLLLKCLGLGQRDHAHTGHSRGAVGMNDDNMIGNLQIGP